MNWHRNAKKICQFVRNNYEPWNHAPMRSLRDYFRWHADRNLLSVVWDNGRVAAVGTVRFFYMPEHYRTEFVNFEDGPLCRCNLYGAVHPIYIPQVVGKIAKGRNPNKLYLWHRNPDELGPPRQYTLRQLTRMMQLIVKPYVQRVTT